MRYLKCLPNILWTSARLFCRPLSALHREGARWFWDIQTLFLNGCRLENIGEKTPKEQVWIAIRIFRRKKSYFKSQSWWRGNFWKIWRRSVHRGRKTSKNVRFRYPKPAILARWGNFLNTSTLYMSILWEKGISPGFKKTERKRKFHPCFFLLANGDTLEKWEMRKKNVCGMSTPPAFIKLIAQCFSCPPHHAHIWMEINLHFGRPDWLTSMSCVFCVFWLAEFIYRLLHMQMRGRFRRQARPLFHNTTVQNQARMAKPYP